MTISPHDVAAAPRMTGRIRPVALPLMHASLDPGAYTEHATHDGQRVFVAREVLHDLRDLERSEHPNETAGLLFGGYFSDGDNQVAVVTKLVRPEPGEVIGTRHSVTITAEGGRRMIERAWSSDPTLRPVGWGHTHPCFEAFFSGTDLGEQRAWKEPASVGIVISGLERPTQRYCVFVGPDSTAAARLGAVQPAWTDRQTLVTSAEIPPPATAYAATAAVMTMATGSANEPAARAASAILPEQRREPQIALARRGPLLSWTGMRHRSDGPGSKRAGPAPGVWLAGFVMLALVLAVLAVVAWPAATGSSHRTPNGSASASRSLTVKAKRQSRSVLPAAGRDAQHDASNATASRVITRQSAVESRRRAAATARRQRKIAIPGIGTERDGAP
jgi:proteasome lid subunit RPN8/RPN11